MMNYKKIDTNGIINGCYIYGFSNLSFILVLFFLGTLSIFFNQPFSSFHFPVAIFITAITVFFLIKRIYSFKVFFWWCFYFIIFLLFILFSIFLSSMFYDISFDGQMYHQDGIILLKQGWNPIHQYLTENEISGAWILNHYPKGPWIYEAVVYSFFNKIEYAKFFNPLLMLTSACFCIIVISKLFNNKFFLFTVLFSLFLAVNPISLFQIFSFYIDGQISSIIIILISLLVLTFIKCDFPYSKFLIFICFCLLINLKFTSVGYAIIFMFGYLMMVYFEFGLKCFFNWIKNFFLFGFISIVIFGFQPYIINTIKFGHPFYPLNKIELGAQPANFKELNRFQKAFHSYFSYAGHPIDPEVTQLKPLFNISDRTYYDGADMRIAGFGSLFNVVIIVSGIGILLIFFLKNKNKFHILFLFIFIILSIIINPEFWWARYVPQIYLIPVIIILFSIYILTNSLKNRKFKLIELLFFINGVFLLILLSYNLKFNIQAYFPHQSAQSKQIRNQIKNIQNDECIVTLNCFENLVARFNENHIKFKVGNPYIEDCIYTENIVGTNGLAKLCVKNNNNYKSNYIFCNADSVLVYDTTFYVAQPENIKINYGKITQSSEKSFSGNFSDKLTKDKQFGMTAVMDNLKINDIIVVKVKRFSTNNNGSIVITGLDANELYVIGGNKINNINEWDILTLSVKVSTELKENKALIYLWNNSDEIVYFDDLEIKVIRSN